ncbi:50S ribosomal protein L24 [Geothrix oryzae]|uniref:Large ribosomal subunit protein uL24 n=1 Tax=Geothrix oryzae TaxID=2927975 RepID=A0ABM8DU85_9BACT|nr:50S ribosomal protein L24 [Geothrix oryzae]BDU70634.1 50S ribosomal protein L24 [Geothrix oryzae]
MEATTTKMKLKKGDQIVVIAGKEKGKTGTISKVSPATNHVVVAGLNMIKKATKPNTQTGEGGGIVEKEAPIHASNVMLLDPKTGKGTRHRSK